MATSKPTTRATGGAGKYAPYERYGHSAATVGGRLYLWAGGSKHVPPVHTSADKEQMMSKTEVFSLRSGRWEKCHTRGSSHSGICSYATATVNEDIYYFGGQCGHGMCCYNSLTMLDTKDMKWKDIRTNLIDDPMKKYSCGMVSFQCDGDTYLLVVGGIGEVDEAEQVPDALYIVSSSNSKVCRTNEHHVFSTTKSKELALHYTAHNYVLHYFDAMTVYFIYSACIQASGLDPRLRVTVHHHLVG